MKELKLRILFKWLVLLVVLFSFYFFGLFPGFIKTRVGNNTMIFIAILSLPLSIIFGNWAVTYLAKKILFKSKLIKPKNIVYFLVVIFILICVVLFYSYISCPGQFILSDEFPIRAIFYLFLFYFLNCLLVLLFLFIFTKKEINGVRNNIIKKVD